jgi:hypothetical protein
MPYSRSDASNHGAIRLLDDARVGNRCTNFNVIGFLIIATKSNVNRLKKIETA